MLFDNEMIASGTAAKSNEWYTKPRYIEAARSVMLGIDLDPASCAAANQIIQADQYYDESLNGLEQHWSGRVWLNPPYTRTTSMQGHRKSLIGLFTEKLIISYEYGDVVEAIALVTTEINAKWYQPLLSYPICIPNHRVNFIIPGGAKHKYSQMFGSCFVYLGPNEDRFIKIFNQFGHVVMSVSGPRTTKESQLALFEEAIS